MHSLTRLWHALNEMRLATKIGILAVLLSSTSARADFYLHHLEDQSVRKKQLRFEPQFFYYESTSNYDANGDSFQPSGFESYQRIETDLLLKYGLFERLSLFGRLAWTRVEVLHQTQGGFSFGFADQTLGLAVKIFETQSGVALKLQGQADIPTYSNETSRTEGTPFLGDGSTDFTSALFLTVPFVKGRTYRLSMTGGGGYTYRTEGFSAAIPWSATLDLERAHSGIRFQLGVFGFQSLSTDTSAGYDLITPGTIGSGGSYMTNAINPSLATVRGALGYQVASSFGASVFASRSFLGERAPEGMAVGGVVHFQLGGAASSDEDEEDASAKHTEYDKSNRGFVTYAKEGKITHVNDQLNLLKINLGLQQNIRKGQVFDIFSLKQDGMVDEAVARAKVISVKQDESALKIIEYFKEVWIEPGFVVKQPLQ